MNTQIILNKQITEPTPALCGYILSLSTASATNIPPEVFVMKRYKKYDGTTDNIFIGVASPTQLEDLSANAPNADDCFYRTSSIQLVSSAPQFLNWAYEEIAGDIALLCSSYDSMNKLEPSVSEVITSTGPQS